jgi:hypothetical protein
VDDHENQWPNHTEEETTVANETGRTPTRVVLYSYAKGTPQAAAEFRWSPDSGVTLTIIEPDEGMIAQRCYERGVAFDAERRLVLPSEGATFMRALVQPSISSYTRFLDMSEQGDA